MNLTSSLVDKPTSRQWHWNREKTVGNSSAMRICSRTQVAFRCCHCATVIVKHRRWHCLDRADSTCDKFDKRLYVLVTVLTSVVTCLRLVWGPDTVSLKLPYDVHLSLFGHNSGTVTGQLGTVLKVMCTSDWVSHSAQITLEMVLKFLHLSWFSWSVLPPELLYTVFWPIEHASCSNKC